MLLPPGPPGPWHTEALWRGTLGCLSLDPDRGAALVPGLSAGRRRVGGGEGRASSARGCGAWVGRPPAAGGSAWPAPPGRGQPGPPLAPQPAPRPPPLARMPGPQPLCTRSLGGGEPRAPGPQRPSPAPGRGKAGRRRPFAFESRPGALSGPFKGRRGRERFPGAPRPRAPPPAFPRGRRRVLTPPLPRLGMAARCPSLAWGAPGLLGRGGGSRLGGAPRLGGGYMCRGGAGGRERGWYVPPGGCSRQGCGCPLRGPSDPLTRRPLPPRAWGQRASSGPASV